MLTEIIRQHAARSPHKPALAADGRRWSYAEFAGAIAAARAFFSAQNLRPGSMAVLAVKDLPQAWALGIALRSLGVTTVPVPPVQGLAGLKLPSIRALITLAGEEPIPNDGGWRQIMAPPAQPGPATLPELPADAPQGGHILMTSGTTGDYKMVLRDPGREMRTLPISAQTNGIAVDSVVYVGAFPLVTAGGYRWPLITWNAGGAVVFHQGGDPLNTLLGSGATLAYATSTTLTQLLQAPDVGLPRRDAMRLLVTGGPLPLLLAQAAQSRLTSEVYSVLASTEALNLTMTRVRSAEDLRWHHVLAQREVQVVDEADQLLPPGKEGLVRARVLDGVDGYLGDAEASRQCFRDGWFYSGDLGEFDAQGRLALHGRVSDVLNVMGNKIAPGALEQEIQDRLGAQGVCVFSVPNARGEEELHIAIQPGQPLRKRELAMLTHGLEKFYPTRHIHVVREMPRNHMGKIQRLALRQQILAKL